MSTLRACVPQAQGDMRKGLLVWLCVVSVSVYTLFITIRISKCHQICGKHGCKYVENGL